MEMLVQVLSVFLSAALMENMVFGRALGVMRTTLVQEDRQAVAVFGLSVLFMCTVSSVLGYGIRWVLLLSQVGLGLFAKQAVLFLAVIISYFLLYLILRGNRFFAAMLDDLVSYAAFNGAVYGSLLISSTKELDLLTSLAHGVGAGVGMVLACGVILLGHRRLDLRRVPRSFRGIPIMLLYIGIFALALYGLVGHNLPT